MNEALHESHLTPLPRTDIQSTIGHVAFDATLAALLSLDPAFFVSRATITDSLSANFLHGGVVASAIGVLTGAVSCVRRYRAS